MTHFKVFSDFACPFCYIGFEIGDRLLNEDEDITIEWIPFILDRDTPQIGSDLSDDIPQESIDFSYRRIERLGKEYDLVYNNKTKKFNTNLLHIAGLYAQSVDKFRPFAREAFKAIFKDGRNVAELDVINDIGYKVGLNLNELNDALKDPHFTELLEESLNLAKVYEIDSVPTFVRDDNKKILLLKEYKKFKKDLLE